MQLGGDGDQALNVCKPPAGGRLDGKGAQGCEPSDGLGSVEVAPLRPLYGTAHGTVGIAVRSPYGAVGNAGIADFTFLL